MEPPTLRKAGSKQEEGFGVQPSSMADLGMVPSLRRSNSSLSKTRRLHHLFSNSAKQENLSSWVPQSIKKKECVYFVESSKLSDAGHTPVRAVPQTGPVLPYFFHSFLVTG